MEPVGFHEHSNETVFAVIGHYGISGINAGNDGLDVGVDLGEIRPASLPPVPPGIVRSIMTAEKGSPSSFLCR